MRYFISCKQQGVDIRNLILSLNIISKAIEELGNETYIFFRDTQNWGDVIIPKKDVMQKAFEEIDKSDIIFVFVDYKEKSEGMLLECGYAKAKNKKIIVAIKKGVESDLLKSIADKVIHYKDLNDLKDEIII
ncbi:MAG: hypothetical protein PHN31_05935 [Candidatus Gracilibacteria bacterium]|nr:hypothetical protein [Candidatus Gracilibacteria bacterium]